MINGEQSGDMPMVFGGVVVAGILGAAVNSLLQGAQHRWFSWVEKGA